jgi:hypothetical protein
MGAGPGPGHSSDPGATPDRVHADSWTTSDSPDLKLAARSLQEILDRPARITDSPPSWLGPDDRDRARRGIYLVIEDRFAFPVTHMSMGEGRIAVACFVRRSEAASTFGKR